MKTQITNSSTQATNLQPTTVEMASLGLRRKTMKNLHYALFAFAVLALAITPAFAGPLTGLYGTGINVSGTTDNSYYVESAPPGAPHGIQALTLSPYGGWLTPPSGSWVNPWGYGNTSAPAGYYDYQTTFTLTGADPGSVLLTGSWAVDNSGYIEVNGALANGTGTSISDPGFKYLTNFTISGSNNSFHNGVNTLDFIVNNTSGPTGLYVDISGTASPSAPEPSSLVLLGSGLLGIAGVARRRLLG